MKSFKSIIKFAVAAVAVVSMSSTLTSCDVIADAIFDTPTYPDYIITRDVHHYHTYDRTYDYNRSYHSSPRHTEHTTVVYRHY